MITTDVENYPVFAEPIQGPWLMEQMRLQAEHVGARVENEYVTAVDLSSRPFSIHCDSGRSLTADHHSGDWREGKWLEIQSEATFKGFGVSACATCDGFSSATSGCSSSAAATRRWKRRSISPTSQRK